MNRGTLSGFSKKRLGRPNETARVLNGAGNFMTLPTGDLLVSPNGGQPPDTQGNDGDWCLLDLGGASGRSQPPILVGPKAGGVWPTEYRRTLTANPRYSGLTKTIAAQGFGPIVGPTVNIQWDNAAPVENPFTGVNGTWATTGSAFHGNTANTFSGAVISTIRTATFENPPPSLQVATVRVPTLPTGATDAAGVGSLHPNGIAYGYGAWVDSAGRVCLGMLQAGLVFTGASGYLVASAAGAVVANGYIGMRRLGTLIEAFALSTTGVLVAGSSVTVNTDAGLDAAFATGPGVIARGTSARMSTFFAVG
jgi:hypothetical protein